MIGEGSDGFAWVAISLGLAFMLGGKGSSSTMSKFDKSGAKYGRFTLEDFTGSQEFMLFKKKYLEFKNFIDEPGSLLFMKVSYLPSEWRKGEHELTILSMELLSEVREKMTKQLTIAIDSNKVDANLIVQVIHLLSSHAGKKPLKFVLFDRNMKGMVELLSRKFRVSLESDVLRELAMIDGVELSLTHFDANKLLSGDVITDEVELETESELTQEMEELE